jgi:hypothetical protein
MCENAIAAVEALVNEHTLWSASGPHVDAAISLLSKLRELEAVQPPFSVVDSRVPFPLRARRLLAWCASHPDFASVPLELADDVPGLPAGARGVRARAAVPAGTTVLSVPLALGISTDSAYASHEIGPLLESALCVIAEMPTVVLSLHVLVEHAKAVSVLLPADADEAAWAATPIAAGVLEGRSRDEISAAAAAPARTDGFPLTRLRSDTHPWGSKWRAYFSCLPERVPNCLFWTERSFRRLAGTRTGVAAARFVRDAAKAYVVLSKVVGGAGGLIEGLGPHFSWAAYRWSTASVMSRQNRLPSLPGTPKMARAQAAYRDFTLSLLPCFDMLNHDPSIKSMPSFAPPPMNVKVEHDGAEELPAGADLMMNYGSRLSHELLMFQGFLTEAAVAADVALLSVRFPESFSKSGDALWSIKTNLLERVGVSWRAQGQQHVVSLAQSRNRELRLDMALAALKDEEKWAVPFDFFIPAKDGGALPAELLSLARVAVLTRADAAVALRAVQSEMERAKAAAESGDDGGAGAGGHSHGNVACNHSHGAQLPPICLPLVSSDNEAAARAFLREQFLRIIRSAEEAAAAAGADDTSESEDPFVSRYCHAHTAILRRAHDRLAP